MNPTERAAAKMQAFSAIIADTHAHIASQTAELDALRKARAAAKVAERERVNALRLLPTQDTDDNV